MCSIVFKDGLFCLLASSGLVPLHNACSYGHFEVTELLLKVNVCAFLVVVKFFIFTNLTVLYILIYHNHLNILAITLF